MPKKDLTLAIAILVNCLFKPCNKKQIHYYNLPAVFRANYKLNNFFAFKTKILVSFYDIVCKFQCCDCNDTYRGKTKCCFNHLSSNPSGLALKRSKLECMDT